MSRHASCSSKRSHQTDSDHQDTHAGDQDVKAEENNPDEQGVKAGNQDRHVGNEDMGANNSEPVNTAASESSSNTHSSRSLALSTLKENGHWLALGAIAIGGMVVYRIAKRRQTFGYRLKKQSHGLELLASSGAVLLNQFMAKSKKRVHETAENVERYAKDMAKDMKE